MSRIDEIIEENKMNHLTTDEYIAACMLQYGTELLENAAKNAVFSLKNNRITLTYSDMLKSITDTIL